MNYKKDLLKNTGIIAIGKFGTQIATFLLLPLYTKLFTTSEYGTFDFLTTLALFLIPCITLLMDEAMFRFLIDTQTDEEKENVISNSLFFLFICSIIICFLIWIILKLCNYKWNTLLVLYLFASISITISNALARGIGNIKLFSFSNFLSSVGIIVLNLILIIGFNMRVDGLLMSSILSNFVVSLMVFYLLDIKKYIKLQRINYNLLKEMISYSIPLVPNSISWVIINMSNRLIITFFIGTSANGIFSIANKFPSIINTVYGFFQTAWKETSAKIKNSGDIDKHYNEIYIQLSDILFAALVIIIAVLPIIFVYLIDDSYSEAYIYIPFLLLATYLNCVSNFYGGIFTAFKETKSLGTTTMISAILNILINVLLIGKFGIFSAVIASIISNCITAVMRLYKTKMFFQISKNRFVFLKSVFFCVLCLTYLVNINVLNYIMLFFSILLSLFLNNRVVVSIIKLLKGKVLKNAM